MDCGKHTPGPLTVGTMEMSKRDFASLHSHDLVTVQSGEDVLAIVWSPDDDTRPDERGARANARLYAAAPDLLTALEQQMAQLQLIANMTDDDGPVAATIEASMQLIKDAQKKARGEG